MCRCCESVDVKVKGVDDVYGKVICAEGVKVYMVM